MFTASEEPELAVELHGVCKRLGALSVLDRIDLSLAGGRRHVLDGPNGSGKTTLLRMLAGLVCPDSGSAHCLGFDMKRPTIAYRRRISYVTQHFSLYEELTVRENLVFVAAVRELAPASEGVAKAIDDFDLGPHIDHRAHALSGGIKQRLLLAAALLGDPDLLLLDEPTAALDHASREAFWRRLDERRAARHTLIVTTHRVDDAAHCDTVTRLAEGRVVVP